jgi:hypothetical protein
MSHRHACDVTGHFWECDGSALRFGEATRTLCMCLRCQTSMEEGDHSQCPIELLACPQHRGVQVPVGLENGIANGLDASAADNHAELREMDATNPDFVPLKSPSPFVETKFEAWAVSEGEDAGFCFLCGKGIAEGDFIFDSNYTHNCPDGRAFEARISRERGLREMSGKRTTK